MFLICMVKPSPKAKKIHREITKKIKLKKKSEFASKLICVLSILSGKMIAQAVIFALNVSFVYPEFFCINRC